MAIKFSPKEPSKDTPKDVAKPTGEGREARQARAAARG